MELTREVEEGRENLQEDHQRQDQRQDQRGRSQLDPSEAVRKLIADARALAGELAARPNLGLNTAPVRELERFAELGLMMAPFPRTLGGLGLGTEPGRTLPMMRLLAIAGGADLALGRIFEGHVNGILLVHRFGTPTQLERLADDTRAGMLSGVWNTGGAQPLGLHSHDDAFRFEGIKTFATGAAFVQRPIVTAELHDDDGQARGWQMTLPRLDELATSLDRSFWHPLGMERSESFQIDFTHATIAPDDLIGNPGDFYRDPMFYGGTIRFAAVQAGAVLRLHAMFADWLNQRGRAEDPYQAARLGDVAILAQEAVLWIERAATVADRSFHRTEKGHIERMHECADMTRTAILRIATRVIQLVTEGVGAHGLLQPFRFERVLRDLTMYLRQPAPDYVVATIGRFSKEKANRKSTGTEWGFWSGEDPLESLPPSYFSRIYQRRKDPWGFETSEYESEKYNLTLQALPRQKYASGLEVGCSIGVLTACLAPRCQRLLSLDVAELALEQARLRCAHLPQVRFEQMHFPQQAPDDDFDLILISEVAYYWQQADLALAADALAARHLPGGHLVLVHLTEYVPDYPLTGDQVHDYWLARPEWHTLHSERHDRFRLDVLERISTVS
jgi:alkylation response protein AidB-like acyl-CoA dehydrogenase/SAM-dependent methyltransferase